MEDRRSIQHFIDWLIDTKKISDNMAMYEYMEEYLMPSEKPKEEIAETTLIMATELKSTIKFFSTLEFVLNKENSTESYFYMTLKTKVCCIDAQGYKKYCQIRLIGSTQIDDELTIEYFSEDSEKLIKNKIKEWENW